MPTQGSSANAWPEEITAPNGLIVLTGYNVHVSVWRGRLRFEDGVGANRRVALLHRASGRLKRLVVLGLAGAISLDAIAWLHEVNASYIQIGRDGHVLAAFGPAGSDRPSLRRAQALALGSEAGLRIGRRLLAEKIDGQLANLAHLPGTGVDQRVGDDMCRASQALEHARTPNELRVCEAAAASAYWSAWKAVGVQFARRDRDRVPVHWLGFDSRSSLLSSSPRLAVSPINALLNFGYALLENQATIAARIVGLDAGVGIALHVDQDHRDSASADLMEPSRPILDRVVLQLAATHVFATRDFYETSAGVCRLTPATAKLLVDALPDLAWHVGRVAEDVASLLVGEGPTPISGRRRSEARPYGRLRVGSLTALARPPRSCRECGSLLQGGREVCDQCFPSVQARHARDYVQAGPRRLAELRERGLDPAHTDAANERRRQTHAKREAEKELWRRTESPPGDAMVFRAEVLPSLAGIPVKRLAAATGLSLRYCALIRRGDRVPHYRWWTPLKLAALAGVNRDAKT